MAEEFEDEKKRGYNDTKQDVDFEHSPVFDGSVAEFQEMEELRTGLHQRHIQMIALAGTIGTGLFLGSGKAITAGGPLGALLGYALIGILITAPVVSVAELSALVPLSGGIIRHAEYFVDPALSFAVGWNSIYSSMCSTPAEIVAAAVLVDFWTTSVNNAVWITIFGLLLVASNIFFVRLYGEIEFFFATLKILLIIGVNLMALVLVSGGGPGGHVYGFQYWGNPGAFVQYLGIKGSLGRFLGFYTTLNNAVYAYQGTENISVAAAETKNPRRNIPLAAKRIFFRVFFFYVISILFVGMLVPSNDPHLLASTGTATQSPFVISAQRAGIQVVPHIINAVVLTSAWSSGNSGLLGASRTLYGLARERRAPQVFARVSRFGIPYVSVLFIALFVCLGYMTLSDTAATVFGWLQSLVAVAALVYWIMICVVYLRFYYAMKAQGISRDRLPWKGPLQPYLAWMGVIWSSILLLTSGWSTFLNHSWDTETFISSYINIPIVLVLYFGFKIIKRTRIVPLMEVPVLKYIEIAERNPEPPPKPNKGLRRFNVLWS